MYDVLNQFSIILSKFKGILRLISLIYKAYCDILSNALDKSGEQTITVEPPELKLSITLLQSILHENNRVAF